MSSLERIPGALAEKFSAITTITDAFCEKHLNDEYRVLIHRVVCTLARKRPSDWTLPSRLADNPLVWMVQINGLMIDIRRSPPELQRLAYEKGLIPFIPAEDSSPDP